MNKTIITNYSILFEDELSIKAQHLSQFKNFKNAGSVISVAYKEQRKLSETLANLCGNRAFNFILKNENYVDLVRQMDESLRESVWNSEQEVSRIGSEISGNGKNDAEVEKKLLRHFDSQTNTTVTVMIPKKFGKPVASNSLQEEEIYQAIGKDYLKMEGQANYIYSIRSDWDAKIGSTKINRLTIAGNVYKNKFDSGRYKIVFYLKRKDVFWHEEFVERMQVIEKPLPDEPVETCHVYEEIKETSNVGVQVSEETRCLSTQTQLAEKLEDKACQMNPNQDFDSGASETPFVKKIVAIDDELVVKLDKICLNG